MTLRLPDLDAPGGDLEFLLGVIFNQRIRAETAWCAPARLGDRLGGLDAADLAVLDAGDLADVLRRKPAVHPFATTMARNVIGTCQVLVRDYGGQPRRLWSDEPSAPVLLRRLTALRGIGHHKASVAIALLAGEYGIAICGGDGLVGQALARCPRLEEVLLHPQGGTDVAADRPVRRRGPVLHQH
ncbi:uncharacterized HhH-GPD family protein [Thermomonospora echinospora]|uniref:Uncharacterized HhH-GPD family protein n=1 Tax=Thermomonospora echinospora TaxID=1992 RepID=A0A1H6E2D5_9ACTN|nr:hypothetical protein [Thermomonospora echinospora]SEG91752.1 uncharacterized HhH-GPD family protein [Thermomonospora echinospora]